MTATAADRWIEVRSGPFQIVTDAGDRGARETLNQLEQVRYLLGTALGIEDLKTLWPVRIVIGKSVAAAVRSGPGTPTPAPSRPAPRCRPRASAKWSGS